MQRIIVTGAVMFIVAGAFPAEAIKLIAWSSQMGKEIAGAVTPSQQTAIMIGIGLIVLFGGKK